MEYSHSDLLLDYLDLENWAVLAVLRKLRSERAKRQQAVAEANHLIRNALQPLASMTYNMASGPDKEIMTRSVTTIDWTLQNVLGGDDDGERKLPGVAGSDSQAHEVRRSASRP